MLQKTKFFDVECAYGRAYDLKQLRRILQKVIGTRVEALRVVPMGRRTVRAVVDLHDYTDVNFKAIQRDVLNDKGVVLIEVASDGSSQSLQMDSETVIPSTIPVNIVSPSTVPVTVEVVKKPKPASSPRRASHSSRPRQAA